MLALFWNLSMGEIALIALIAVLVFGRRLPEVAGQAMRNVARLRRQLDDLRRESGIDREIYDVKSTFRDLGREVSRESEPRPAAALPVEDRTEPPAEEDEASDEPVERDDGQATKPPSPESEP
ncbi:MAG: twin-arginine translocase TatA/TatE family subunit [Planctomycetota bacterium]